MKATSLRVALAEAQSRAVALFEAIEDEKVVRAGETETSISRAIFALASERFGVAKHWHRRVVRAGPNTRLPYRELPPVRVVEADDIVSLDLGPVFGTLEADFGRTYVLGEDPAKLRLRDDLAIVFEACSDFYFARPSMTGRELHAHVLSSCAERGYGFGNSHAGHLIGGFPFSADERDFPANRIRVDNDVPMNALGSDGQPRHWVLEIHLLDPTGCFGGFYEQLLARPVTP